MIPQKVPGFKLHTWVRILCLSLNSVTVAQLGHIQPLGLGVWGHPQGWHRLGVGKGVVPPKKFEVCYLLPQRGRGCQTKPIAIRATCPCRLPAGYSKEQSLTKWETDSYDNMCFSILFSPLRRKGSEPSLEFNLKIGPQCMCWKVSVRDRFISTCTSCAQAHTHMPSSVDVLGASAQSLTWNTYNSSVISSAIHLS